MRNTAISLVVVGILGAMALGGRGIAADRTGHLRSGAPADSITARASNAAMGRVWYGGTLAPIVVEAQAPDAKARQHADCARAAGN